MDTSEPKSLPEIIHESELAFENGPNVSAAVKNANQDEQTKDELPYSLLRCRAYLQVVNKLDRFAELQELIEAKKVSAGLITRTTATW